MQNRFSDYKFRCSGLGGIVSKSGNFTDGNKTYIEEVFIGEIEGVRKEAYGKALEKGKWCEQDGVKMLQDTIYKGSLVVKNKVRRHNDFIRGECDVFKNGIVYDIKNAYDRFSFGKAELSHNYYWQLVGYMWLWEAEQSRLFYCLNNMPDHLLVAEEYSLFYKNKGKYLTMESEDYLKDCEELRKAHNYDNKPVYEKFKVWDVPRLESDIENLKSAIGKARGYMNDLYDEHLAMIENNQRLMGLEPSVILAHHDPEVNATIVEKAN